MRPVYDESDPYEELARGLIRVSAVLRQDIDSSLAELSAVPRDLVRIVVRYPGHTVQELAAMLQKQNSNTSAAVSELERHGFVARRPDTVDRRSVRVYPTTRARDEIRRIYRQWALDLRHWAAQLTEADRVTLAAAAPALQVLTAIAETHHTHPSPSK